MLLAALLGCVAAVSLKCESLYYTASLVLAGVRVAKRCAEALWVGFFLIAITSQLYPIQLDELGVSIQGGYRPYTLAIIVVAGAMVVGLFRRTGTPGRATPHYRRAGYGVAAFAAVFFLALAYGYFRSARAPELIDVFRNCSGTLGFLVFLFLGFRLLSSVNETERSFVKLEVSVLAYSIFFILKFVYLSLSWGAAETAAGFGYSQRLAVYFSGLVLVIVVAQFLSTEVKLKWQEFCLAAFVLVLAILFSGSRAILFTAFLVTLLLAVVRYSKGRVRVGVFALVAGVFVLLGLSLQSPMQTDPKEGVSGYLSDRFLAFSAEDTSLLGRASEMVAVRDAIREHPVLGRGPLASYSFLDPVFGWKETTFVDSGIGYLLMKTGILGTVVFFWFAFEWLKTARGLLKAFPALARASLASFVFYLVYMPFGCAFFDAPFSWFIGLVVGQAIIVGSRLPMERLASVPTMFRSPQTVA